MPGTQRLPGPHLPLRIADAGYSNLVLRALLPAFLSLTGCAFGYRAVSASDSRLADVCYGAVHTKTVIPVNEDGFRFVAEGRIGAQFRGEASSATVPGGVDDWHGVTFEAEAGAQMVLHRSEPHTIWAEATVQAGILRSAQHLAGPSGSHDHVEDPHEVHVFGEVGGMLRAGYSFDVTEQKTAVGIELGVGVMHVAARGMEYLFEVRLLNIRW